MDTQEQPIINIETILALPPDLQEKVDDKKRSAVIGTLPHILSEFDQIADTDVLRKWRPVLHHLKAFSAAGRASVRSDVFPSTYVKTPVAHEAVEIVLGNLPQDEKMRLINTLNLGGYVGRSCANQNRPEHFLAVVYEYLEAKKLGILDEYLSFDIELHEGDWRVVEERMDITPYELALMKEQNNLDIELAQYAAKLLS